MSLDLQFEHICSLFVSQYTLATTSFNSFIPSSSECSLHFPHLLELSHDYLVHVKGRSQ